jgi:hypothetical protein
MKGTIIIGIIVTVVVVLLGLATIGLFSTLPYTFSGTETFDTFAEAQQFQSEFVAEAERVGAAVLSFDLSITSPPKVKFQAAMPNKEEFKYGGRAASFTFSYSAIAGLAAIFLGLLVTYWYLAITNERDIRREEQYQ